MDVKLENKQKILIADDSEMNRSILIDMLGDDFEIIEALNGVQAVSAMKTLGPEISLVLLDIVMPEMDGFEVLAVMNKYHWIEDIPVIMISAENNPCYIQRAYDLGVTDFISRPFDALVVQRRVINTIMLYAKQKKLVGLVADQIYEKERNNSLMVSILSHIVEFRNGESGLHVLHINIITEILLKALISKTDRYNISQSDISRISLASSLHDIGKIAIPEEIINKPGRLTPEEFEIMKTHSVIGASMLDEIKIYQDEPLVKTAYEICRWHHERYDGRGYPDGLKGDEIPISAQIVSLADVYDALTSERVYKKAFSHETAMKMINNGECGSFSPILLECLADCADTIQSEVKINSLSKNSHREIRKVADEMRRHEDLTASERTLRLLEYERLKYQFFASMSKEIQFEYTAAPPMITLSEWGSKRLGMPEITMDPHSEKYYLPFMTEETHSSLFRLIRGTTPESPESQYDCLVKIDGIPRWHRIVTRSMWSSDETPEYMGVIGKVVDIQDDHCRMEELQRKATHDELTGLLNHAHAKEAVKAVLSEGFSSNYALAIIDLDYFKKANDYHGHSFGDKVLSYVGEKLKAILNNGDIAARIGGDEFMLFFEYDEDPAPTAERIFNELNGDYNNFSISASMGVSVTQTSGKSYEELFSCADKALYAVKKEKRRNFKFYDNSLEKIFDDKNEFAISKADTAEE